MIVRARIAWKNEPKQKGGLFNRGNWIEFPPALTGVDAKLVRSLEPSAPHSARFPRVPEDPQQSS